MKYTNPYIRKVNPLLLFSAFGIVTGVLSFIAIADEMLEGDTLQFDQRILLWFRQPNNLNCVIGPTWFGSTFRSFNELGSTTVLALVVFLVVGFLLLSRKVRMAGVILFATSTGGMLNHILKGVFGRGRPSIVPHLDVVSSASFPSGHSMLSALVYLTLAGLLSQVLQKRRMKAFVLASGMFLPFLVGISRVVLGVHYPSDVLAGWAAGLAWAFLWLLVGCFVIRKATFQKSGMGESLTGDLGFLNHCNTVEETTRLLHVSREYATE